MRSRGPGRLPRRDRASLYAGPPFLNYATVSRVSPPSGGRHRTAAVSRSNPRIAAARSILAVCRTSRGGEGSREEQGYVIAPSCMGLRGRTQPFCGLCLPWDLRARSTNHRRSWPRVLSPSLQWNGGVLCCVGLRQARCWTAPPVRPLRAQNASLPRGHGGASDDPWWEERARRCLQKPPGSPGRDGDPPRQGTPECRSSSGGRPQNLFLVAGEGDKS